MSDARLVNLFEFQRPIATWSEIEVARRDCEEAQSARRAWCAVAGAVVGCGLLRAFGHSMSPDLPAPGVDHALVFAAIAGMLFGILVADLSTRRLLRSFSAIDSRLMDAFIDQSAKTAQHGLVCQRFNAIEGTRPLLRGDLDAAYALLASAKEVDLVHATARGR